MNLEEIKEINFQYLLRSRRDLVFSAALLIFSALILFLAIVPEFNLVTSKFAERTKLLGSVDKLSTKASQLDNMTDSQLFTDRQQINSALPSNKPLLELMTSLSQTSETAGVTVSQISLSPGQISTNAAELVKQRSKDPKAYDLLDLDLTITGTLTQVNDFLRLAESTAPLSSVTKLSLTEKGGVGSDLFEAELTISAYFFTQTIKSSLEAPLPVLTSADQEILAKLKTFSYPVFNQQQEISGGGLQDLFKVEMLKTF